MCDRREHWCVFHVLRQVHCRFFHSLRDSVATNPFLFVVRVHSPEFPLLNEERSEPRSDAFFSAADLEFYFSFMFVYYLWNSSLTWVLVPDVAVSDPMREDHLRQRLRTLPLRRLNENEEVTNGSSAFLFLPFADRNQ
jgi:hypothetical protein